MSNKNDILIDSIVELESAKITLENPDFVKDYIPIVVKCLEEVIEQLSQIAKLDTIVAKEVVVRTYTNGLGEKIHESVQEVPAIKRNTYCSNNEIEPCNCPYH